MKKAGKFAAGVGLGIGLGLLFAPKKGTETRKELKIKLDELCNKAKNIDVEEVKTKINGMIADIKEDLTDLDKEKAIKLAQEKGSALLKKADELVKYAVEKGTPVLQKTAKDVKKKVVEVLEETTAKLKESDKK